jgi:hypothetical protein
VESTVSVRLKTLNPPAVKVTLVVLRTALRPAVADIESVTVPVKPLMAVTLIRVWPVRDAWGVPFASCHAVTRGPIADREEITAKSFDGTVIFTVTGTLAVLDSVLGAVPVVPVIVRVKLAGVGTAVQLTDKLVPETLAVQPVGAALVDNETLPENPLIGATEIVDELVPLPTVGTTMMSEDGLAETEKSTAWNVTEFDGLVCTGEPPLPVTVAG